MQHTDIADCESTKPSDGHEKPKVVMRQLWVVENFAELAIDQDQWQEKERRVEISVVGQQPNLLPHHRQHLLGMD